MLLNVSSSKVCSSQAPRQDPLTSIRTSGRRNHLSNGIAAAHRRALQRAEDPNGVAAFCQILEDHSARSSTSGSVVR
ncbi:hypothetical protein K458DRAFT_136548 [Lentithecium fluviatile CBS 122367]|uniref:Uncharacterized protein n=1 Tax=Lentithecium fluviatile CBS 122367 TaxID=1168545 RepID=A0A6G1IJV4_9PLEO|nr:hypothetical protein K458DRAFT_136548 [Lentithecium fluviatile CBS 122367]